MRIKHCAVLAGLVGTLALGGISVPATAYADETVPAPVEGAASDGDRAADGNTPEEGTVTTATGDGVTDDFSPASTGVAVPTDYDKADFYEAAPLASTLSTVPTSRAAVTGATDEMKYFTLYESGQNYDQGFSKWDGYHAMGYYQFDRRYSLVPLMRSCYEYDPVTFAMFKPLIDRAAELSSADTVIFDTATGRLTEIGQLAEDAWHAAYAADPATFAALQDSYAISNYYQPTERRLKSELGIDMSGRADCVKGLVWSLTNLFGTGGVRNYLCAANLTNDMSDREFVNAIVDSLPSSLTKYNTNTKYHQSWINRYEKERATCLAYIAEDEVVAEKPSDDAIVDEGDQNNQVDSAESAESGAQNSTNEDSVSNDAVTTPQPVPPASSDAVIPSDDDDADDSAGAEYDGTADGVAESIPPVSDAPANNAMATPPAANDAADTTNNAIDSVGAVSGSTNDASVSADSATGGEGATDAVGNQLGDTSMGVDTSVDQPDVGSTDVGHKEPVETSDGETDLQQTATTPAGSPSSTNGQVNEQTIIQTDGKTDAGMTSGASEKSDSNKNDSSSQKATPDAERLPHTGDVSSTAFAAISGIVVLGGSSIAVGSRLERRSEEAASGK